MDILTYSLPLYSNKDRLESPKYTLIHFSNFLFRSFSSIKAKVDKTPTLGRSFTSSDPISGYNNVQYSLHGGFITYSINFIQYKKIIIVSVNSDKFSFESNACSCVSFPILCDDFSASFLFKSLCNAY